MQSKPGVLFWDGLRARVAEIPNTAIDTAVIVVATLLIHGLLLLNDGVYWDGWLLYSFLYYGNYDRLYMWLNEAGMPGLYYMHRAIGAFPDIILSYKIVAFLSILAASLAIYGIAVASKFLNRIEALGVATISMAYTAYQISIELIVTPYLLCYASFFVGWWMVFRALEATPVWQRTLSLAAVLCLLISFNLNSFLAFHIGFVALLCIRLAVIDGARLKPIGLRALPLALLPVAFWIFKSKVTPVHGIYKGYNSVNIEPAELLPNFGVFLERSVLWQVSNAFASGPAQSLWPWIVLTFVGYGMWRLMSDTPRDALIARAILPPIAMALAGVVLLILAILPYVVVGKVPTIDGWDTRHAILVGLPVALFIVAALRVMVPFTATTGSALRVAGIAVLLLAFGRIHMHNYYMWQARAVKDKSIMAHLKTMPNARQYSAFLVDDRFHIGQPHYLYYEWSGMFRQVWGDESHLGLPIIDPPEFQKQMLAAKVYPNCTERYNLGTYDPKGRRARLIIERGTDLDNPAIAVKYLRLKLANPQEARRFVYSLTKITLVPKAN